MGLVGAALALAGCGGDTYTWNQKLTVTVNTPDGEKSGSAVTQVTAHVGSGGLNGQIAKYSVKGEATIVDLGGGKYLFALLSSGGNWTPTEYWATIAFSQQLIGHFPHGAPDDLNDFFKKLEVLRASATLTLEQYPLLVTFADIANPKSVKEVKPGKFSDVFGPGYALKSIKLEITDEAVTAGRIANALPWTAAMSGSIGKSMKLPYDHILNQINDGSFLRGL